MQTKTKTLIAAAALVLQAARGIAAEKPRHEPAIEKTADAYLKAVLAADLPGVLATYHDDAVLMPQGQAPLVGRAALEQYYRRLFEGPMKIGEFTFSYRETVASGNNGYTTGSYRMKLAAKSGPSVEDTGSFIVIVKRDGGSWKAAYVIYNSDRPMSAPPGPAATLYSPIPALLRAYRARYFPILR